MAELEDVLSYGELLEWMVYDQIDPFGGYRQDLQTAHILAAKYGDKDSKLIEFLPIDPMPMTDEMRADYEERQALMDAEKEAAAMMAAFERLEHKQAQKDHQNPQLLP